MKPGQTMGEKGDHVGPMETRKKEETKEKRRVQGSKERPRRYGKTWETRVDSGDQQRPGKTGETRVDKTSGDQKRQGRQGRPGETNEARGDKGR